MEYHFKRKELEELGFRPNNKGFNYLYDAINIRINHPDKSIASIFSHIALKNDSRYVENIERAISNCLRSCSSSFRNQSVPIAISNLALMFIENTKN